jgi:5-(carboxyamino)imidazole ribonucleotide mutase
MSFSEIYAQIRSKLTCFCLKKHYNNDIIEVIFYSRRVEVEYMAFSKRVAIVMGSKSDFDIIEKAVSVLDSFGAEHEIHILSAHRTPDEVAEFAKDAVGNNFGVIIAAAGKSAALPGAIAAYTTLPVIGLPIKSSFLDGLDSLLSMTQMPAGIPVATVGTNAAENAALLAVQIIAVADAKARVALEKYKVSMRKKVLSDNESIK